MSTNRPDIIVFLTKHDPIDYVRVIRSWESFREKASFIIPFQIQRPIIFRLLVRKKKAYVNVIFLSIICEAPEALKILKIFFVYFLFLVNYFPMLCYVIKTWLNLRRVGN